MNQPHWLNAPIPAPDPKFERAAIDRQARLTKPAGSLGRLERIAVRLAALQGTERPRAERVHISIFAADHGVAQEGVSAFAQSVTAQMINNFASGGAAISVLARQLDAPLEVINLGTVAEVARSRIVRSHVIASGTANLVSQPAMSMEQCVRALEAGRQAAWRAFSSGAELFIGGEMGIANTTSSSALAAALLRLPADRLVGPGTGLDHESLQRKADVIDKALRRHARYCEQPLEALRRLGGFEIAALVGAYLSSAQQGVASLVDGFISSVAALCALRISPELAPWLIHSHQSAEPGHAIVLQAMNAQPLLQLDMRLGEASGAAIAMPLLQSACALHCQMATFDEAGVCNSLASGEAEPGH